MSKKTKLLIALSLILQIVILRILSGYPEFIEQFYSQGLYIWISKLMRYAFGWLPFSFGDLFYTIGGFLVLRWLWKNRKRILKDTWHWLLDVLSTLSIVYFAFHVLWAFNYYRLPLHKSLKLESSYSTEALINVTQQLIKLTNASHLRLVDSDTLIVNFKFTKSELLNQVPDGFKELSKMHTQFVYTPKSIKRSLYSLPLTYMGFSGYLNPFTNEAQIDGLIPKFKYPSTASHEVAHQLGYAAENEANFIGSLAAIHNPNPYFKYSGYAFTLRHCLGEVYRREPDAYYLLIDLLNTGVRKNYREVNEFWSNYQNPLEPLFKTTYSTFLKANSQAGGIESYSYVVALYVNYLSRHQL